MQQRTSKTLLSHHSKRKGRALSVLWVTPEWDIYVGPKGKSLRHHPPRLPKAPPAATVNG
jgi:hypothetical protein